MLKNKGNLPIFALIAGVILVAAVITAVKPFGKSKPNVTVSVPGVAVGKSPALVPLGEAVDPASGKLVEGFAFIDYGKKKGFAKPPCNNNGICEPDLGENPSCADCKTGGEEPKQCFAYLAKETKWKTVEPWIVNTSNKAGLDGTFVFDTLSSMTDKCDSADPIAQWEDAAEGGVIDSACFDILGSGSTTTAVLVADTESPDGDNEVYFADIETSGAIAVTIVWGIFRGPPFQRELVEWDQIYDDTDFDWSETGEAGKMDFANIAQHELGHADGMGHPDDSCTEETMYRYTSEGETKKRDLNAGDITGIDELY